MLLSKLPAQAPTWVRLLPRLLFSGHSPAGAAALFGPLAVDLNAGRFCGVLGGPDESRAF